MAGQELKSTAKEVLQMTKDGAVNKNLADGTAVKVSGRTSDFSLKQAGIQEKLTERSSDNTEKTKRRRRYSDENIIAENRIENEKSYNDFLSREQYYEKNHKDFWLNDELYDSTVNTEPLKQSKSNAHNEYTVQDSNNAEFIPETKTDFDISAQRKKRRKAEIYNNPAENTDISSGSFYSQSNVGETSDSAEYDKNSADNIKLINSDNAHPFTETVLPPKRKYRLQRNKRWSFKLKEHKSKIVYNQPSGTKPAPPLSAEEKQTALQKRSRRLEQKKQYTDKKLKEAENRLPKRNVLKFEKSFDGEKGKRTAKLTVNKEVAPFNKKDSIIKSGVKKGTAAVGGAAALSFHREIQKYEDDNSALKAAHGAEKISEKAVRSGVRAVKTASVKMREEPYKRVSKLKFQSEKADSRLTYSKNRDTVKTVKSSKEAARKAMMKQNTKKAQKTAGKAGKSSKDILGRIGKKAASLIASNKVVIIVVIIILLILVIFFGVAFIFVTIFSESGGAVISSTYMSEDEAMLNAESYMTSLEDDLQSQIDNIPNDYSGYDEYRYNLDEIGHDPYTLCNASGKTGLSLLRTAR